MFGWGAEKPTRSIESFLEADERIIWIDRFNPTRPRMRPVRLWPHLRREWFQILSLLMLALVTLIFALNPNFGLEIFPDVENPRLVFILGALVAWIYVVLLLYQDYKLLRFGERMEFDFLLTQRRILAKTPLRDEAEIIALSEVISSHLDGAMLVLTVDGPDKEIQLPGLADPDDALQALELTLAEFRRRSA